MINVHPRQHRKDIPGKIVLRIYNMLFVVAVIVSGVYNMMYAQHRDYLYLKYKNDFSDSCAYVDYKGEIIIPYGKYSYCFTDTFKNIAFVQSFKDGLIAMDRNEKILFKVFNVDNGPDYPSEGLFRIVKNNKIGFANLKGEIVIEPKFDAVYPFHNGLAAFCNNCITVKEGEHELWQKNEDHPGSGGWGFINKKGDVVIPPVYDKIIDDFNSGNAKVLLNGTIFTIDSTGEKVGELNNTLKNTGELKAMNYHEWVKILGSTVRLITKVLFEDKINVKQKWLASDEISSFENSDSAALQIDVILKKNNETQSPGEKHLVKYIIYPRQNFSKTVDLDSIISPTAFDEIFTVTEYAVIYTLSSAYDVSSKEHSYIELFNNTFKRLTDYENNQKADEEVYTNYTKGLAVIEEKVYKHYIDLNIAVPGSALSPEWGNISNKKMIHVKLIPDIGQVKDLWFKPARPFIDTYYTSVETELQKIFSSSVEESIKNPKERMKIYNEAASKIRDLFNAANSYVNFLYDKYENKLKNWLLIHEYDEKIIPGENSEDFSENIFPDYEPKRTPDTALDFMPSIYDEVKNLPSAKIENIVQLVNLFNCYAELAEKNPGEWVEGNIILGANPNEYFPSKEELITAMIGDRLQEILTFNSQETIQNILQKESLKLRKHEYTSFTFIHYDVMGSGRFFYVESSERIQLKIPN